MDRIPFFVVTGFLGSGKTTLLQQHLATPAGGKTGVVVNEFGEIGLDHRLLVHSREHIELIDGGCMCCARRSDIGRAFHELARRAKEGGGDTINLIAVETTGLADPSPIISSVGRDAWMKANVRLQGTICVFDSVNGLNNLSNYSEARRQVAIADIVVVTKQDLRKARSLQEIAAAIHEIAPDAHIVDSQSPDFDFSALMTFDRTRHPAAAGGAFFADDSSHGGKVGSFVVSVPERLDWPVFTLWLSALLYAHGNRILRVKGLIRTSSSETPLIVHGVQHVMHPPTHLARTDDDGRDGFLVFITDGLEQPQIERSLHRFQTLAGAGRLADA